MTKIARSWLQSLVLVSALSLMAQASLANERGAEQTSWPAWQRFSDRFIQADGRVIDITFDAKSTSEGQSYGLFFALVANQPQQFATILNWTSANLAGTQLGEKLPGWLWGKRDDGSWGLKDANAASDADLFIAYALLEAGRLWQQPQYTDLGQKLLTQVNKEEVVEAGAAGTLLLPGPIGFELSGDRYRLNPSYLPGFMFHYFSSVDPKGPWQAIWDDYMRIAPKLFASGVAPDMYVINKKGVVSPDSERAPSSSYDAIRVYLWAGMSRDADSQQLLRLLAPYAKVIRANGGAPPEKVNPANGVAIKADYSPIGYSGAVLPFVDALRDKDLADEQRGRLRRDLVRAKLGADTNYYDQMLILFGEGWQEGYYRFDEQGRLQPKWHNGRAALADPQASRD